MFDAHKEIEHMIQNIRQYFEENGTPETKAVIGISGGKDSTIAAALLVRALGPDRVIGVRMPNKHQTDADDAARVCTTLGIVNYTINIGDAYDHLVADFVGANLHMNDQIATNTPARLRMATLYMVAAAVGGRVINTGNASELAIGYTTKYGDLAGDFAILRGYYVREVYAIGDALEELPYALVHKAPSDGMCGKTDEDNLGFTYEMLDNFLIDGIEPSADILENILTRSKRNWHKSCIQLPYIQSCTRYLKRG